MKNSIKTTVNPIHAFYKLCWLYGIPKMTGKNLTSDIIIKLKYKPPVGKIRLKVRTNRGADSFILGEVFEQECYRFNTISEIKYIIDLGANAGFTAVYFAKSYPRAFISCVEPMPENIKLLTENICLNNINVTIFHAAIATADQTIEMAINDYDYGHKVNDIPFGKPTGGHEILKVEGISMGTLLDKLKWPKVDLLKIDIEGYEGILFQHHHEWLHKVDSIIMEIHEGVSIDLISEIVKSYGLCHVLKRKGNWIFSRNEIR
ncbi:MAG: FkbM family methyltransferase [Sphingobacteriaceae bacterium]